MNRNLNNTCDSLKTIQSDVSNGTSLKCEPEFPVPIENIKVEAVSDGEENCENSLDNSDESLKFVARPLRNVYKVRRLTKKTDPLAEHNYCNSTCDPVPLSAEFVQVKRDVNDEDTLLFSNTVEMGENRIEQQTIENRDSITKLLDDYSPFGVNCNNSKRVRSYSFSGNISDSAKSGRSNTANGKSVTKKKAEVNVKEKVNSIPYSLRSSYRLKSYLLNGDDHSAGDSRTGSSSVTSDNVSGSTRKVKRGKKTEKLLTDFQIVTLNDIAKQLSEMEKILQSKAEQLSDNKKDKNNDVIPPKLKKVASKEDASESQKDNGQYILPMPKLTKMVPEDKNWNLEYTGDDVKNLALDDLLLKASELNAENFTKALGQNSRNGNKPEASDFVVSFPNPRRDSDDSSKDCELPKNSRKTKLDFLKKYVKDGKAGKTVDEESPKIDISPKKPGIKVKTVQNINEEFKDSLGSRLKNSEETMAEFSRPIFAVADDVTKINCGREAMQTNATATMNSRTRKLNKEVKNIVDEAKEARPFIMTIIQNKDGPSSDHVTPITSSPKCYSRSKNTVENIVTGEELIFDGKKANDRITLVMSEPRLEVEDCGVQGISQKKSAGINSHYVVHYRNGALSKKSEDSSVTETGGRKKNASFHVNPPKKFVKVPLTSGENIIVEEQNKRTSRPNNRLIRCAPEANAIPEKCGDRPSFVMTSVEQRISPKESCARFTKANHLEGNVVETPKPADKSNPVAEESESDPFFHSKKQSISLSTFANILKDILPEKWVLSLDKRFGLQIIKTHMDELLNPSIMISVVVGKSGRVVVNVRGRQLEKSHKFFSNLGDAGNSDGKVSISYILGIINKLRFFNVCFGCDDLSLKKYWCEDGFIEYYTEFQQTYRSHICELLVRLGKKRCYPCYRMHESLKKRKRREQAMKSKHQPTDKTEKAREDAAATTASAANSTTNHTSKGIKRNLEEFLEESFINMKQRITDEIEKTKEDDESEKVPRTQDEVLSFMGLTRKDSLDANLRKSKRERKGYKKCDSDIGSSVNKEELYFLEKYWQEINVLFSTSLLIGAYSRTSTGRLREKCKMFHKLLSTWRAISRDNPDWVGGCINVAENLVRSSSHNLEDNAGLADDTENELFSSGCSSPDMSEDDDDDLVNTDLAIEKFNNMDVPSLRAYIINSVKEVNKIKSRLRTKNNFFKVLYNTFVKPKMKKARQSSPVDKTASKIDAGPAVQKSDDVTKSAVIEIESSDEKDEARPQNNGLVSSLPEGFRSVDLSDGQ